MHVARRSILLVVLWCRFRVDTEDRRAHQIHDLRKVFAELDVAASGKISMSQFTAYMKNEEAIALFAVLGIEVSDALILFNALDLDESQEVEVQYHIGHRLRAI